MCAAYERVRTIGSAGNYKCLLRQKFRVKINLCTAHTLRTIFPETENIA